MIEENTLYNICYLVKYIKLYIIIKLIKLLYNLKPYRKLIVIFSSNTVVLKLFCSQSPYVP